MVPAHSGVPSSWGAGRTHVTSAAPPPTNFHATPADFPDLFAPASSSSSSLAASAASAADAAKKEELLAIGERQRATRHIAAMRREAESAAANARRAMEVERLRELEASRKLAEERKHEAARDVRNHGKEWEAGLCQLVSTLGLARDHCRRALEMCGGDVNHAAEALLTGAVAPPAPAPVRAAPRPPATLAISAAAAAASARAAAEDAELRRAVELSRREAEWSAAQDAHEDAACENSNPRWEDGVGGGGYEADESYAYAPQQTWTPPPPAPPPPPPPAPPPQQRAHQQQAAGMPAWKLQLMQNGVL